MMSSNPGVAPALLSAELGVPMSKMELLEQRINGGRLESTGADATQSSMQDSAMDTDSMDMDQSQGESSLSQPTRKRKRNFTPEEDERIKEVSARHPSLPLHSLGAGVALLTAGIALGEAACPGAVARPSNGADGRGIGLQAVWEPVGASGAVGRDRPHSTADQEQTRSPRQAPEGRRQLPACSPSTEEGKAVAQAF